MPQIVGSGAALFDFDGDGRLDIYLLQNGGPKGAGNRLYRQRPDGTFADVSRGSGLDIAGHCMGVAIGDANNDGRPDVLVTQYGGVRFFLNQGEGRGFRDVTEKSGLVNPLWGTSAAFLDYDRDGWLDLVVVNYVDYDPSWPCTMPNGALDYCSPKVFPGTATKLFHNRGQSGSPCFEDVTVPSGLGRIAGPGLGVLCADFDGDGWIDIFVANDAKPNHLWINRRDGTFVEEAVSRGVAYDGFGRAQGNMGIAFDDVDGDGLNDLFISHMAEEYHTLWQQGPRGFFRDRSLTHGLVNTLWRGTGFGTALIDFDHDGALDLAVVNGRVSRMVQDRRDKPGRAPLGPHWSRYAERNQLFANDGTGKFRDLSRQGGPLCAEPNVARGLAYGDIDGDGAIDLLVTTIAGPARIYRNIVPQRGHWLMVRAYDAARKRDAIGATVRVKAAEKCWRRRIDAGGSYMSSSDPRAHFGLGQTQHVDSIHITWPDGTKERFSGMAVDQCRTLHKGTGSRDDEP